MFHSRSLRAAGALSFLALLVSTAGADVRYLYSALEGAQEVPPVPTPATGDGLYVLDDVLAILDYEITFQNLTSPENAAHFHGPALPGVNAGVLHGLALGSPKLGAWPLSVTNVSQLLGGLVYLNVHTNLWPGGEIRGQLELVGRGFCFGDGSGTPCPCGNSAGPHEGCRNTAGAGARLRPAGFPAGNGAGLRMVADRLVPSQAAILFVGTAAANGGAGSVIGDGLFCAGGAIVRYGLVIANGIGRATWGPNLHTVGGWAPGDTRYFQVWQRDSAGGGVCGNGFNTSNGVEIAMLP